MDSAQASLLNIVSLLSSQLADTRAKLAQGYRNLTLILILTLTPALTITLTFTLTQTLTLTLT